HNDYFYDLITYYLFSLSEEEAIVFRLKTQYTYSLILEADKIFLALKEPEKYLDSPTKNWDPAWVDQYLSQFKSNKTNEIRNNVRQQVLDVLEGVKEERIFSLTAPTGVGKTLLAASWALKMRQKVLKWQKKAPKIIVVLPFLSVIEQTAQEYAKILETGGEKVTGAWMIQSHSLAERCYGEDSYEQGEETFYLDTWKSELIITTYDQLLLSLTAPESRYQMRFHNLCNAIIVLDEVQSLPCRLWYPLDRLFSILAEKGNSYFLLMSATLPPFIKDAQPLLPSYQKVFQQFGRYRFSFQLEPCSLEDFCVYLQNKRNDWLKAGRRILITLNTRNSAKKVRDSLALEWPEEYREIPLFFLSADVTPKDRLLIIEKIKEGNPCLVVSTQCIEARVDMDMQEVYRDFAPLDSLIQIAGRCNRNWNPARGNVNIVNLLDERGNSFAKMVYDEIHLAETYRLLEGIDSLQEEEILPLAEQFFAALAEKKNTGKEWLSDFAYWQDCETVREILRGKNIEEHQFLVLKQDPELLEAMEEADSLEDRWARREAWRKLAGRIAQITVRIRSRKGFHPGWYGEPYHNYWLLNDEFYETERGILVEREHNSFIL
ncbi:MAG: CRISPR-associated helicase Cas3', partial [Thermoanaerobacteraceae bacterium]|nr:CRISPR-associated helicase Cas3' [Thermoanaerobacteraceae bacterium]